MAHSKIDMISIIGDSGGICVGQESKSFDDSRDMFVKLLVQYKKYLKGVFSIKRDDIFYDTTHSTQDKTRI